MTIKSDKWIKEMCEKSGMITPFLPELVRKIGETRIVSAGISGYGYDVRLSAEKGLKMFSKTNSEDIIDPKAFDANSLISAELKIDKSGAKYFIFPPNTCALSSTVEYFKMPRSIIGFCFGKSTYSRCGIFAGLSPLEPEWTGYITIMLYNSNSSPVKLYAEEGIAQIVFLEASDVCAVSYADRAGKYQDQQHITTSKV